MPGNQSVMYMLGQLYVHKSEFKTARELLEQVANSSADEQTKRHSESLLTQIKTIEEQKAKYEAAREAAAKSSAAPSLTGGSSSGNSTSGSSTSAVVDMEVAKEAPPNDPSLRHHPGHRHGVLCDHEAGLVRTPRRRGG